MNETPKKIIRNTVTNALGFIYIFASNIVLVPFILHSLGAEMYGSVWVVIGALTAYIGLLDLGTGTAFVKYIAEYHTKNLHDDVLEVINTGIVMYAVLSLAIAGAVLLLDTTLLSLVGVSQAALNDAQFVLRISVTIFVLVGVTSPITAIISALQRMDIFFRSTMIVQTWTIVGTVIVLNNGEGVRGLILVNLTASLINIVLLTYYAKREMPFIKLLPRYVRWEKCQVFLLYGTNIQISRFSQIILFQTDRVLSLKFFGPLTATYYDISARLTNAVRSITGVLLTALIPAVSAIDAQQNIRQLSALYFRGTKYLILAASCFFVFVGIFAENIIAVWLGDGFATAALFVRVLSIGYFFNIITGVASSMTAGLGRTDMDRNYGILVSIINIVLVLSGAAIFGAIGIAAGTTVSFMIGAVYFFIIFHRSISEKNKTIFTLLVKPITIALFCAITLHWISDVIVLHMSRIERGVMLLITGVCYSGAYLAIIVRMSLLDEYDKDIFKKIMNKVFHTVKGSRNVSH